MKRKIKIHVLLGIKRLFINSTIRKSANCNEIIYSLIQ